jgi:hypothetical protein
MKKLLTTVLAAGIVVVAACTDSSPTAPLEQASVVDAATRRNTSGGRTNSWRGSLVTCENRPAYQGSAEIGPRGGTIVVGRSRVIVPPGALTKKVRITATMPAGEHVSIHFEFSPHGLVFKKPAGLILDASDCNVPYWYAPSIVYLSDSGEILEYLQSYYSNYWHTVAAPIWHFSSYAIAW